MTAIRPEEQSKFVLVFVKPTCPHQKVLGHYIISTATNRDGGVRVPFRYYAESWADEELVFREILPDGTIGDELDSYTPPIGADEAMRLEQNVGMTKLANSIAMLVKALGGQVASQEVMAAVGLDSDSPTMVIEPDAQEDAKQKARELITGDWRQRVEAVGKVDDPLVLQAIRDELNLKARLGVTNKTVLDLVLAKLSNTDVESVSEPTAQPEKSIHEEYVLLPDEEEDIVDTSIFTGTKVGRKNQIFNSEEPLLTHQSPTDGLMAQLKQAGITNQAQLQQAGVNVPPQLQSLLEGILQK